MAKMLTATTVCAPKHSLLVLQTSLKLLQTEQLSKFPCNSFFSANSSYHYTTTQKTSLCPSTTHHGAFRMAAYRNTDRVHLLDPLIQPLITHTHKHTQNTVHKQENHAAFT
ncbi:hypothetical protein ILYODFUR_026688 [Ilyodon furcidens]|uniref:Uncharacterized protein n=1 Tax=Ilyodon furcidens TaxID=33524 RepID=A0ABV0SQS9_9TELE